MAGIGFRLRQLVEGESIVRHGLAYLYSALIVAGPWLFSTAIIFLLSLFHPKNLSDFDLLYFRTAVTYVFAFSLMTTGGIFMAMGRYLSDRLFAKDIEAIVSVYNSTTVYVLLVQFILSIFFFLFADGQYLIKLLIIFCYMATSLIWVVSSFLTIVRDFNSIGWAFGSGGIVAILLSHWLGHPYELAGYLIGYLSGLMVILTVLSTRIFIEFRSVRPIDQSFLRLLRKGSLVFAGFFYMVGTWIDKFVLWWSPRGIEVTNFFRISPDYDSASFFAILTIIPALAIFLIYVETEFYERYKAYYQAILNRGSLGQVVRARREMVESLQRGLWILVRNQAVITMAVIVFAPQIVHLLHLRETVIPVLRIMSVGSFCLSMFLLLFTLIAYFDYTKICMGLALFFCVTNGLLTWAFLDWFPDYLGYGFFLSASLSMAFAYLCLDWGIIRLEHHTFSSQKMIRGEG